jgi:hypothetical protein
VRAARSKLARARTAKERRRYRRLLTARQKKLVDALYSLDRKCR